MNVRIRPLAVTGLALAFALGAAGCSNATDAGDAAGSGAAGGKVKVVAVTDVWGSVAAAVGGDRVEVSSIINRPDADPHSYETTPQDAVAAQGAGVLLGNGGGYDDFFAKLADQAPNARKLVAYDIGATGDENEHVWYSFATVDKVADQLAATLGELAPADRAAFTANATAFKAKVDAIAARAGGIGAAKPGAKVVSTEPVAHYLLAAAGVADATPEAFAEAVEEETDVPAAALAEVTGLVSGRGVNAVVNNVQTTTPTTEKVLADAKAAGLPVVDVSETLPAGQTDYAAWIGGEVDELAGALR